MKRITNIENVEIMIITESSEKKKNILTSYFLT